MKLSSDHGEQVGMCDMLRKKTSFSFADVDAVHEYEHTQKIRRQQKPQRPVTHIQLLLQMLDREWQQVFWKGYHIQTVTYRQSSAWYTSAPGCGHRSRTSEKEILRNQSRGSVFPQPTNAHIFNNMLIMMCKHWTWIAILTLRSFLIRIKKKNLQKAFLNGRSRTSPFRKTDPCDGFCKGVSEFFLSDSELSSVLRNFLSLSTSRKESCSLDL